MESFERAHAPPNKDSSRKGTKADENTKRQLRQMLHGYKNSDNEAIKHAADLKNDAEDSSSVSGYSDLNITNSTIDGDDTRATVSFEDAESSSEGIVDNLGTSPPNIHDCDMNQSATVSVSITSVSDCDEDLDSLSDLPCEVHETSSQDGQSSPELSLNSSFVEIATESDSNQSGETDSFDTDGVLAAEILQKLKNTKKEKPGKGRKKANKNDKTKNEENGNIELQTSENDNETQFKGPYRPQTDDSSIEVTPEKPKRKTNKKDIKAVDSFESAATTSEAEDSISSDLSLEECSPIKQKKGKASSKKKETKESIECKYKFPSTPKKKENSEFTESYSSLSEEYKGPYRPKSMHTPDLQSAENESLTSEDTIMSETSEISHDSSPFVSVNASDMACESFGDILGEYCNPAVKNLPSDLNRNVDADLFATEDMNVDDVVIEEDADSLVPEVDDNTVLDDIDLEVPMETLDLEMEDLAASPEIIEESYNTEHNDTHTSFNDTMQSQDLPDTDTIDNMLVNSVKVYYPKKGCIFVLKHPAEIYVHGKVKVQVMGGTVEVLGYTLKDKTYEVYAPNYNYAQCLKTVDTENAYYGLFGKLTASGLTVAEAEEIVTTLGDSDGVIAMQALNIKKVDFISENFTTADLFNKPSRNIEACFKRASEMLGCSLYLTKPWKSFEEDSTWKHAVECGMNNPSRAVVCGGKGVGKSTFLRYYVNRLLSRGPVLVVDLDPGQCEFTPAGNVSATVVTDPLLGPSYTHLRTPEIMFNLGMISTMDNVRRYAAAVQALITHCFNDETLQSMPWIINTMGMTNAIGMKFMALIILLAKPTHLLQIDSKNPKKRYPEQLRAETVKRLLEKFRYDHIFRGVQDANLVYTFLASRHTESGVKNNFSLAPRDERYLNFLAYFGELLGPNEKSLLDIVPYEVNLSDLYVGMNVKISEEMATKVLNGKVVALCTVDSPPSRRLFTLDNVPVKCHGHGLIRGIDCEKGTLYIITPVRTKLGEANTLVYADWVPEIRGTEAQLPEGVPVPYRTASHYPQRHFMFAPKRRFNPLQLVKMTRTT